MAKKKHFRNNNDIAFGLVPLSEIIPDEMFHVRTQEDQDTLDRYTELWQEYKEDKEKNPNVPFPFPPIGFWQNGDKKVLMMGFHRYYSAKAAGLETIPAQRFAGNKIEALKLAVKDNSANPLSYKHGDYKVCIRKLLEIDTEITPKELKTLTGASRTYCYMEKKRFEEERQKKASSEQIVEPGKMFTSEHQASGKTEGESGEAGTTEPKALSLIYWGRLKKLTVGKRIVRFLEACDQFIDGLPQEKKTVFLNKSLDRLKATLGKLQEEQEIQQP